MLEELATHNFIRLGKKVAFIYLVSFSLFGGEMCQSLASLGPPGFMTLKSGCADPNIIQVRSRSHHSMRALGEDAYMGTQAQPHVITTDYIDWKFREQITHSLKQKNHNKNRVQ